MTPDYTVLKPVAKSAASYFPPTAVPCSSIVSAKTAPHQRMSPRLILQLDAGFFTSNPHEALMYWILPALCCLIPGASSGLISYVKGQGFAGSVRDDLSAEDRGPGSLLQNQRR